MPDLPTITIAPQTSAVDQAAEIAALKAEIASLRNEVIAIRTTPALGIPAAPYEVAIAGLIRLAQTVIDSQPPEVRQELWQMYLQDMKRWQAFWAALRGGLGDAFKASAQ